jgi:hypothetical protein
MQGFYRIHGDEKVRIPVVALAAEVFAVGSPVGIDSSGYLVVAAASEKIWGYCTEALTAVTGNEAGTMQQEDPAAVGYCPRVIEPDNVDFWADADEAWTQTSNGQYADIASVAAGVATLNLVAGATGQFHVMGRLADFSGDPAYVGDTTKIVVRVAEPMDLGFAQT